MLIEMLDLLTKGAAPSHDFDALSSLNALSALSPFSSQ